MTSLKRLSKLSIDSNDLAYALISHALIRNGAELAHRFTDPELGRVQLFWDDRLLVSLELSPRRQHSGPRHSVRRRPA